MAMSRARASQPHSSRRRAPRHRAALWILLSLTVGLGPIAADEADRIGSEHGAAHRRERHHGEDAAGVDRDRPETTRFLERGESLREQLASYESRDSFFYDSQIDFLLWSAAAEIERGRRPTERIESGLALADEAISRSIVIEEHIGYRGALRYLESRLTSSNDERLHLLEQAEEDLSEALRRNRWLSHKLDPWLAQARRALESGPRVEDDVS